MATDARTAMRAKNDAKRAKSEAEAAKITLVALNRRASFDYELHDKYEAGIALSGTEVKMLRLGKADLTDTWVQVDHGEAYLRGMNIPVLMGSPYSHEAKRARKLLLHKKEIETLHRKISRDGMTVVSTKIYFKGSVAKVEIALARGKKHQDKRASIKEKDVDREAKQAMMRGRRGGK